MDKGIDINELKEAIKEELVTETRTPEIEKIQTKQELTLIKSTGENFVKEKDIIVLKGHMFFIQSISPKKLILKLVRRFKQEETLVDGIFCYIDKNNKLKKNKEVLSSFGKRK